MIFYMRYQLITVLGPTAVGKTQLAVKLAYRFNGEIISADSRQVYKRMDIGTGKDLSEYFHKGKQIRYHLIDLVEPAEEFNLFLFQKKFFEAFNEIISKGKIPFLVGGTGLYLSSVLQGYNLPEVEFDEKRIAELKKIDIETLRKKLLSLNPNLHNKTDLENIDRLVKAIIIAEKRPANLTDEKRRVSSLVIGIRVENKILRKRIEERLERRLKGGMIEEVENLLAEGITHEKLRAFGLEYKYVSMYLQKEINYNDLFQKLSTAIYKFAKRQMTWFRKMEREGVKINWIEGADYEKAKQLIETEFFEK